MRISRCWISSQWSIPLYQSTCVFPLHPVPGRILSRSVGAPKPQRRAAKHLGHTWKIGNRFCRSSCVLFSNLIRRNWIHGVPEEQKPILSSTAVKGEKQTPVQDLRCQSGPSVKRSVILSEGDSFKNYGADEQRLQISDLHFDKFPRLRYVLVHNFLRKLCCGSKKWRWLIQWMI